MPRKKSKKRDGLSTSQANIKRVGIDAITDVDPALQSIYEDSYSNFGLTSYGKYNKRTELAFECPSKASNEIDNRRPRGNYQLFRNSNFV